MHCGVLGAGTSEEHTGIKLIDLYLAVIFRKLQHWALGDTGKVQLDTEDMRSHTSYLYSESTHRHLPFHTRFTLGPPWWFPFSIPFSFTTLYCSWSLLWFDRIWVAQNPRGGGVLGRLAHWLLHRIAHLIIGSRANWEGRMVSSFIWSFTGAAGFLAI